MFRRRVTSPESTHSIVQRPSRLRLKSSLVQLYPLCLAPISSLPSLCQSLLRDAAEVIGVFVKGDVRAHG